MNHFLEAREERRSDRKELFPSSKGCFDSEASVLRWAEMNERGSSREKQGSRFHPKSLPLPTVVTCRQPMRPDPTASVLVLPGEWNAQNADAVIAPRFDCRDTSRTSESEELLPAGFKLVEGTFLIV